MDCGINVGLGTDSLASNNSLSMLDEMRYLFSVRRDLKSEEILGRALEWGRSLHFGGVLGRLRRGYWADLRFSNSRATWYKAIASQILEGTGECIATIVQGKVAWCKSSYRMPDTDKSMLRACTALAS